MFMVPHAFNQIIFASVVVATVIRLPPTMAIHEFLGNEGRIRMKNGLGKCLVNYFIPGSPIVLLVSVNIWFP
jgi:hypothetical protein